MNYLHLTVALGLLVMLSGCGASGPQIEDGECFLQWPPTSQKEMYDVQISYDDNYAGEFSTYKTEMFVDCPEAVKVCYLVSQAGQKIFKNCF